MLNIKQITKNQSELDLAQSSYKTFIQREVKDRILIS